MDKKKYRVAFHFKDHPPREYFCFGERSLSNLKSVEIKYEAGHLFRSMPKNGSLKVKRDRAMIAMMALEDLRAVEIERANVEDLETLPDGSMRILIHGKGGDGYIYPRKDTLQILKAYIKHRGDSVVPDDIGTPLFAAVGNRSGGYRLPRGELRTVANYYHKYIGIRLRRGVEGINEEQIGSFGPEPGQVSLYLANTSKNELEEFIGLFAVTSILDGDGYNVKDRNEMLQLICWQKSRIKQFIQDVLLALPPNYPELQNIPPSKRLAVFINTNGGYGDLEPLLRQIDILPYSKTDIAFFQRQEQKNKTQDLEESLKKRGKAWKAFSKSTGKDKTLKTLTKYYLPAWTYESNDILGVGWLELFQMAENNIKVKTCRKCNRFYVPWPPNALHCSRCKKEYTTQELYRARVKDGEIKMTEKHREERRKKKSDDMKKYRARLKAKQEAAIIQKESAEKEEYPDN